MRFMGTYAFVHDSLEIFGFTPYNRDITVSLHARQRFELAVDELLGLFCVF